jgi:hypothetical protein
VKTHRCVDCIADPPATVRPIVDGGGPRSQRCATHARAALKRRRVLAARTRARARSGLTDEELDELHAFQDGRCPCGRPFRKQPCRDHCHYKAREHDHPEDRGCRDCMRGLLCGLCNQFIDKYSAAGLRALADYRDNPPWQRLLRSKGLEDAS